MRIRLGALAAATLFIVGCDNSATSPRGDESAVLVFDQAATTDAASGVPRGPFMDRQLPDSIKLTDVQKAAIPVLRHRIGCNFQAQAEGLTSDDLVKKLLAAVPPREEGRYDKRKR